MTRHSSSDPATPAQGMLVLEGMPGAGKTSIVELLAQENVPVLGEYTSQAAQTLEHADHPPVHDDDAHDANWLLKAAQACALLDRHQVVACDRDWLSALAYAHSVADYPLLTARAEWVADQLAVGRLLLAHTYAVFDLDAAQSQARRGQAVRAEHPWREAEALDRARAFYSAPISAVARYHPALARTLEAARWMRLSGSDSLAVNLVAVRGALDAVAACRRSLADVHEAAG
ncbi:AAA family ATPase [Nonomuraea sp. NPDC050790]|uniref:AAA family ATPase n=1 Tax=Nonomuraea sp. NPDC050790 TaxID=3364371 RepID=UPI003792E9E2